MKIIIDIHIFIWAISAKLKKKQIQALQTLNNTIYVSSISEKPASNQLLLATTTKDGGSIGFASLHGSNLLEQCRSNCRGAKTSRALFSDGLLVILFF